MNYIKVATFSLCVFLAGCAPKLYPEGDSAELNSHQEQRTEEVTIDEGTVQRKSSGNSSLSNSSVDTTLTEINLQGVR